ncbi:MAG TPA: SRPBCC family protein [Blastocatellia bacterium]|nr:SRPBCC family protein [Blastocatellia bacterium]
MRRRFFSVAAVLLLIGTSTRGEAASIRKEIHLNASPSAVWDAVRDFGNVDKRLVPGFVVDVKVDGDAREVTFANGNKVRELLVSSDDDSRRLVYAITGGRMTCYSASLEVLPGGSTGTLLVWTVDFLPNEFAGYIKDQMDLAAAVIKRTLDPSPVNRRDIRRHNR